MIAPQILEAMRHHRYSAEDRSYMSLYVLGPFWWNPLTRWCPKTLAPNTITLVSFVCVFLMLYLVNFVCEDDCSGPSWLFAAMALLVWTYQTADAVDGKHARAIKSSTPLGELWDHGFDNIATLVLSIVIPAVYQVDEPWLLYVFTMLTMVGFFGGFWETFHTDRLVLEEVSAPVEGNLLIEGLCIATYLWGPSFWKYPIVGVPFGECMIWIMGVVVAPMQLMVFYKKVKASGANMSLAIKQWAHVGWLCACGLIWALVDQELFYRHVWVFEWTVGMGLAHVGNRLLCSHMGKKASDPYPLFTPYLLAFPVFMMVGMILFLAGKDAEWTLYAACAWLTMLHMVWFVRVTQVMLKAFNIQLFVPAHMEDD